MTRPAGKIDPYAILDTWVLIMDMDARRAAHLPLIHV
jgi:hypothetical protein